MYTRLVIVCMLMLASATLNTQSAHADVASTPRGHTTRRLGCADNVNLALSERGIVGSGSSRALDFLKWGVRSRPLPGAVAVYGRGRGSGHVAVVSRVMSDGTVCVFNPNRRGWRELCNMRMRTLGFRTRVRG